MNLAAIRSQTSVGAATSQSDLPADDSMNIDIDFNIPGSGSEEPEIATQSRPECRSTRVTACAPSIEQVRWWSHHATLESSDSDTNTGTSDSSDSLPSDESDDSDSDLDLEDESGGLTAWELLGEDFEREAHSLGA